MIAWYDIVMPTFFWVLTMYLWRPSTLHRGDWRDRRVLGSRVFVLCLAISMTIQADPFGAYLDRAVGLNNLSWLVGYLNAVVAMYAGTAAIAVIRHRIFPGWLTWVTLAALTGFLILSPWVLGASEELHDQLARSFAMLLFREVLYVYLFIIALYGIQTSHTWLQGETHPTGHVREGFLFVAFASGFVFTTIRAVASVMVYLNPTWKLYDLAVKTSEAALVLSAIGSVLALAPVSWLRVPVLVMSYLQQQWALHDLQKLRAHLVAATGELQWTQPPKRDRWLNPPFVLYCTFIDILDRRMLLQANLQSGESASQPAHEQLASLLANLPETSDWVQVVKHLRQVARKIQG